MTTFFKRFCKVIMKKEKLSLSDIRHHLGDIRSFVDARFCREPLLKLTIEKLFFALRCHILFVAAKKCPGPQLPDNDAQSSRLRSNFVHSRMLRVDSVLEKDELREIDSLVKGLSEEFGSICLLVSTI